MKNKRIVKRIIVALIVVEILMSLYMIYDNYGRDGVCAVGGCDIVKASPYSQIFGIELFYIALPAFIALLVLFYKDKKIYLTSTAIGAIFALYLISLQLFVIRSVCINCMTIDVLMLVIAVISAIVYKKEVIRSRK